MKKFFSIILMGCALSLFTAKAQLSVSKPAGNGMVLQQKSEAAMWGNAARDAAVTITPSWNGRSIRCRADKNGRWRTTIKTPAGSYKSYMIKIRSGDRTVTIDDVLVGEVWLASGQSNMEMPMRGFYNCPVENANEFFASAPATERIRMFTVPKKQSYVPLDECEGEWKGAESSTIPDMSATAYFFALKLNSVLNIPIGIVCCPYGGAKVESWMPRELLGNYPDIDLTKEGIDKIKREYLRPMVMYNAMLHPLVGYTIKGFIWYQGCSNVSTSETYKERFEKMVSEWRREWGDTGDKLPFYTVEIAPYRYKDPSEAGNAALLREAQHEAAKEVPNCGIVITNDLVATYEEDNIHPSRKQPVGNRLAYLALHRDYGFKMVACYSPTAAKCTRGNGSDELAIEFDNAENGMNRWREIEGLEVAGSEGVFYPVTFAYYGWKPKVLRIRSEFVPDPCEVRYGWGDFRPGNLKSVEGLPVTPFDIKVK
ncbi:MAG: sialate O-acetylesterase [Bacteroidales bacterium]|nr:sialate O-acetylesterase [Bacteroidales bacterium]MCI2122519.1 sialate O-acetylesterase [Bacteroidales bacterium]MCI2145386.1 sialate O-acetylesterase [Bacteroidales bacterium]